MPHVEFGVLKRTLLRAVAIVLLVLLLVKVSGYFGRWQLQAPNSQDEVTLYVVSHGWHSGVVVPLAHLSEELAFVHQHLGKSPYVEFGWGDAGFYQAEDITASLALKAMFWPTPSVMHVVSVPFDPARYFSQSKVVPLTISKQGMARLNQALVDSFQKEQGNMVVIGQGIYGNSLFFKGSGKYFLTNTCNTWTAKVLSETGAPIHSFLTLTAGDVIKQSANAAQRY